MIVRELTTEVVARSYIDRTAPGVPLLARIVANFGTDAGERYDCWEQLGGAER